MNFTKKRNIRHWNYQKGIERIWHRGSDGQRVIEYEDCILRFDRLAIMDLSKKVMQPLASQDGNVEYMLSLAENEHFYDGELKTLLKKAYEDVFLQEILYRKKKGFVIPGNYVSGGN